MLDWTFKKDFGDRHYILTNRKGFFCRYIDSGFRTKWCGLWMPPIKHIEYYAYCLKGYKEQWLSWDNCVEFSLNPWGALHKFKLPEFDVSEIVFVPEGMRVLVSILKIKNNGPRKRISVLLEAAVNTRKKHENWHPREYHSEFSEVRNWVAVRTEATSWSTAFGIGRIDKDVCVSFFPKNEYKEHNPGSLQRCFLPGNYEVSFDMEPSEEIELPFIFSCSEKSMDETTSGFDYAIRNWKGLLEGKIRMSGPDGQIIRTPDKEIDKAFVWNVMGLESLIHESRFGTGILAGLPWFTEFWARDSFISIPALNHIGKYEISRKMLEMFISRNIPSKIDIEGNEERDFADTLPLFLLAVKNYLNSTGDLELLMQVKKQISHIAKKLQLSEGLVIHDPEKTWMDSYARGKSAIEVQSLWCEVLGETNTYLSKTIENNIKIGYWNPKTGYFLDSKNPDIDDLTVNCIAPVFFGQVEGQKVSDVLDSLTRDFMSKWGIRTRSIKDKEYKPDSYHKGSVWGLTTGAAACTYLKHNRIYNGVMCLKAMASEMGINAVGSSGEALNADTGELLGCGMQAWSSAMFITAVDGFVFGIIPELDKNLINIQPRIPDDWNYMERFGKRIGKHKMNLLIRRDHARLVVDINFDSSPLLDAKLVLPSNIKKMIVNGKVFIGNSVCFELRRQNNIVALP